MWECRIYCTLTAWSSRVAEPVAGSAGGRSTFKAKMPLTVETHILIRKNRVLKKEIHPKKRWNTMTCSSRLRGRPARSNLFTNYGLTWRGAVLLPALLLLTALMGLAGCGTLRGGKGPLSPSRALDRYERRIFTRPDGTFLDCYISKPFFEEPTPLVFYCQGWGYASTFESLPFGDYMDVNGWIWERSGFGDKIRLAFVENRGVRFGSPLLNIEEHDLPEEFLVHDTKENRVEDVCFALRELEKDPLVDPEKVALLGHGEGAAIAAAAARKSAWVTHLGYLANGGLPRLVELLALKREALKSTEKDPQDGEEEMDEIFRILAETLKEPGTDGPLCFGQTPAHFVSFALCPPLDDLLELEIPIFVAAAGQDPHVPLFSSDAIRAAFLCQGKNNLTFEVYPDLDHGFTAEGSRKTPERRRFEYPRVFDDFCEWFLGSGLDL
jgi:dienelactone hydrolase